MAKGKPTDPALRAEIMSKVRDAGMSVTVASATYGFSSKTIYTWLRDGVVDGNRNLILENNKLRKELEIAAPANALAGYAAFKDPTRPQDGMSYAGMTRSGAWVQDFTYLRFQNAWYYLAAVLDLETREIVGWRLGTRHSSELTYEALLDALSRHAPPAILHSDQGSEYLSRKHQELCDRLEITLSCSAKSSPWQNGFMERLMLTLQLELGSLNRFNDLGQLHGSYCAGDPLLQYQAHSQQPEDEPGGLRCRAQNSKRKFRTSVAES